MAVLVKVSVRWLAVSVGVLDGEIDSDCDSVSDWETLSDAVCDSEMVADFLERDAEGVGGGVRVWVTVFVGGTVPVLVTVRVAVPESVSVYDSVSDTVPVPLRDGVLVSD